MKIKLSAFGDRNEAFIEDRFSGGVNIVYSNDNNKGKTLVIQGLLYALGNTPIFPAGFDKRKYYFYTKIDVKGVEYEFLRKNETIIIKHGTNWQMFDSLSELKYHINKNLFSLPEIEKKGEGKIADLDLFYQLFAVGQDKRNTSTIQNSGYYNKTDFMSMLNAMVDCSGSFATGVDVEQIKREVKEQQEKSKIIRRKITLLKENPQIASLAFNQSDREDAERHRKSLEEIHGRISGSKRKRSREINRRGKLENLLSELNSLNQTVNVGKIICAKCGSDTIVYSNGDLSFEISNSHVRKKVVSSLREQISLKGEIIDEISAHLNTDQARLLDVLSEIPVELKNVLIFSDEIISEEKYSTDLLINEAAIQLLKENLGAIKRDDNEANVRHMTMMKTILTEMNRLYHLVDKDGTLTFKGLFSKHGENYSGSEEQEFYFCKLLSLNSYFKHQFPLIMDSFRSGELSTQKEKIMIEFYKNIGKQVILTSTLKSEEYENLKYDGISGVKAIDYSQHQNSQILQPSYAPQFSAILDSFGVSLDD